jgi:hypothetical protein
VLKHTKKIPEEITVARTCQIILICDRVCVERNWFLSPQDLTVQLYDVTSANCTFSFR